MNPRISAIVQGSGRSLNSLFEFSNTLPLFYFRKLGLN